MREKLDHQLSSSINQCFAHLQEAKREIDSKLQNCKVRSDEHEKEFMQMYDEYKLPVCKFELYSVETKGNEKDETMEKNAKISDDKSHIEGQMFNFSSWSSSISTRPDSGLFKTNETVNSQYPTTSFTQDAFLPSFQIPQSFEHVNTTKRKRDEDIFVTFQSPKKSKIDQAQYNSNINITQSNPINLSQYFAPQQTYSNSIAHSFQSSASYMPRENGLKPYLPN